MIVLSLLLLVSGAVPEPQALTPSDETNHLAFVKKLSGDQVSLLSGVYPDFRIVKLCSGRFSGAGREEWVLGVWSERKVHRAALIWNRDKWEVHVIDDEIGKDANVSHSFPMKWQYSLDKSKGFSGNIKCGVDPEFKGDSDLTRALGDKPFFDLRKEGCEKNSIVCFATDDVYNNWDCLVYIPKDGRFRLWFQQAHAD